MDPENFKKGPHDVTRFIKSDKEKKNYSLDEARYRSRGAVRWFLCGLHKYIRHEGNRSPGHLVKKISNRRLFPHPENKLQFKTRILSQGKSNKSTLPDLLYSLIDLSITRSQIRQKQNAFHNRADHRNAAEHECGQLLGYVLPVLLYRIRCTGFTGTTV